MLLHAAPDRQLKKKGVDVDICREILGIVCSIGMEIMEVMKMLMLMIVMMVMMKRLDDLQRSVDSICGASQKGVVWQKKGCNLTTNSQHYF